MVDLQLKIKEISQNNERTKIGQGQIDGQIDGQNSICLSLDGQTHRNVALILGSLEGQNEDKSIK